MITEQKENRLKPLFLLCGNDLGPVNNFDLDQLLTLKRAKLGPVNNFTAHIYIYIYLSLYISLSPSLLSLRSLCLLSLSLSPTLRSLAEFQWRLTPKHRAQVLMHIEECNYCMKGRQIRTPHPQTLTKSRFSVSSPHVDLLKRQNLVKFWGWGWGSPFRNETTELMIWRSRPVSAILIDCLEKCFCTSDRLFFHFKSLESVSAIFDNPWGSKSVPAIVRSRDLGRDERRSFQLSQSGDSLNGPTSSVDYLFCRSSYQNLHSPHVSPSFSKKRFSSLISALLHPLPQSPLQIFANSSRIEICV